MTVVRHAAQDHAPVEGPAEPAGKSRREATVELAAARDATVWGRRFQVAVRRYQQLGEFSREKLEAVAEGLAQWAQTLPQHHVTRHGVHLPVNEWGLDPELDVVHEAILQLTLEGQDGLAERLERAAEDLRRTARSLDERYPLGSPDDEAAVARIVGIARARSAALAAMALRLRRVLFRKAREGSASRNHGATMQQPAPFPSAPATVTTCARPHPKRAPRLTNIEKLTVEVARAIQASVDHRKVAESLGRAASPLPVPSKAQLARLIGVSASTVTRCFKDPAAKELQVLWGLLADPEQLRKYGARAAANVLRRQRSR